MFAVPMIVFGFYLIPILLIWQVPKPALLAAFALAIVLPAVWLAVTLAGGGTADALGLNWWLPAFLLGAAVAGFIIGRIALPIARWFGQVHPRGVVPTWIVAIVFLPGLAFYGLMGAQQGPLFSPASVDSAASPQSK